MKKLIFGVALASGFAWAESFISVYEYGEMLYKNPRGIGCDKCHGKKGEGMELGSYKRNEKIVKITAPLISLASFSELKTSLSHNRKRSVMPRYFLTDGEIEALAYYLKKSAENNSTR